MVKVGRLDAYCIGLPPTTTCQFVLAHSVPGCCPEVVAHLEKYAAATDEERAICAIAQHDLGLDEITFAAKGMDHGVIAARHTLAGISMRPEGGRIENSVTISNGRLT